MIAGGENCSLSLMPFSMALVLEDEADHCMQLQEGCVAVTGLFEVQVISESMSRLNPNGAWCLFRANLVGSR